jgi:hypothetical protein
MFGRRRAPKHPTPQQAYEALSGAFCMYAPVSKCSGPPRAVGLRHDLDDSDVLVCGAHFGRLRKLDERSLDELEHSLKRAFGREDAAVG